MISGKAIDSLLLRIAFDGARPPDDRLDGPFQVDAPLRYLVGPFTNACVERLGSKAVIHFPMPFRIRAGHPTADRHGLRLFFGEVSLQRAG